ncbi:hypothetical protein COCON_G00032640 [Conger conger]|uniref:Dephospho-CoA kinase domain-containing protein n=1 Tax=Conger conger TaxID=82655 RepID=A0A9Q1I6G9_CONCO|nr:hypothetical protein COCON_G00032640 [Conger conger]
MFLVGLTGGIASGKSTVSSALRDLGCPIIDADVVARQVVEPNSPAYCKIVQHFGSEILLENGEIDRQKLGQIVFSCTEKRKLLNSITHPEIHKAMLRQILFYFFRGYRYVVLDVPLLFETRRLTRFLNHTVVVYCDPATQLSRLMQRDRITQEQAEQRIASQMPLNEKRGLANHVIENSGSREDTHRQALADTYRDASSIVTQIETHREQGCFSQLPLWHHGRVADRHSGTRRLSSWPSGARLATGKGAGGGKRIAVRNSTPGRLSVNSCRRAQLVTSAERIRVTGTGGGCEPLRSESSGRRCRNLWEASPQDFPHNLQ